MPKRATAQPALYQVDDPETSQIQDGTSPRSAWLNLPRKECYSIQEKASTRVLACNVLANVMSPGLAKLRGTIVFLLSFGLIYVSSEIQGSS